VAEKRKVASSGWKTGERVDHDFRNRRAGEPRCRCEGRILESRWNFLSEDQPCRNLLIVPK
jgi:hypothetical protein